MSEVIKKSGRDIPKDIPTPLTKSRISKDRRMMFLPDIVAWMNDESRRKMGVKSRRIGLSYGHAYDRVSRRVKGLRRKAYYTGVSLDMAREYIDYCAFHARTFSLAGDVIEGSTDAEYRTADGRRRVVQVATFSLRFPSEAEIMAMPSRPAALRGRGGDMDADEYAFHEDQAGLYKAAVHVTKWGGQFAAWSSHHGEGTQFHNFELNCRRVLETLGIDPDDGHADVPLEKLAAIGRELRVRPVFSYHRTTIERAVDQGLVELLNAVTGSTHTRESFLTECRDECLNDEHYGQEYMCRAVTALLAALKYHVIEGCQHEQCPAPIDGWDNFDRARATLMEHYTGGPVFAGIDVGDTGDPTAFWLFESVGDVLWSRLLYRMRNESMVDQENAAKGLFAGVRLARCAVLRRGVGVGIHAHLDRTYGSARIAGIDETRTNKVAMVGGFVQCFEDHRIRVPLDQTLKESLHSMREVRTPGGQVTYDAPRRKGGHADEFSAGMAAVDAASLPTGGLTEAATENLRTALRMQDEGDHDLTALRRRRAAAGAGHALAAGKGVW